MSIVDFENNFFGRKSILDLLSRRVIDLKEGYRQNLAFVGERFIGKSLILRKFVSQIDDPDIIDIYLDLENKNFNYLVTKFSGSILYNFAKSRNLALHDDLNLMLESTKKLIPQTVEAIRKIQSTAAKGKTAEAYRDLIALPEIFTLESGKFCVIILDEFHYLADLMIPQAFQELGKKIMTQKRCLYIMASSMADAAREILSEKLSLLFGNFEIISTLPFDLKTSRAFIEGSVSGIKIGPDLRDFLVDFTGGRPFYLNILLQEIARLCAVHAQTEVFLPVLSQAIENTIFSKWGILACHFEFTTRRLCGENGSSVVLSILLSLANGRYKTKDIVDAVDMGKSLAPSKLKHLIESGIVAKNGHFYYLEDKLYKYWLKYILQKRLKSLEPNSQDQSARFKSEIEDLVYRFRTVSQKDLTSRVIELLHCFDNESFSMNGRRYVLPLFDKIVPFAPSQDLEKKFHMVQASSKEEAWFIILNDGECQESDIHLFLSESKKIAQKPQRRVLVSLNELDVNTKLKALQEKMWIWNEGELNTLLNLYDKPYIIK